MGLETNTSTKTALSSLLFLQNNVGRNPNSMTTCLQIGFEQSTNFILIQEPYIGDLTSNNPYTVSHPSYYCFLPETRGIRPRVVIFAKKRSRFQLNLRPDLCSSKDLLIGDIIDTSNKLDPIQLINIYNEKSQRPNTSQRTIERDLVTINPSNFSIIAGNFNAYYSW